LSGDRSTQTIEVPIDTIIGTSKPAVKSAKTQFQKVFEGFSENIYGEFD
jgi:hypothetical protein